MNKLISIIAFFFVSSNFYSQKIQQAVDSIVSVHTESFPEVGISIGIYNLSEENYYSYGKRNKEGNLKIDNATIFEIGSATKTFTALLLAQEIANKKINQYDFIDSYLPEKIKLNCAVANKILITDLATHQSGLPNLSNDHYFSDLMEKDEANPFRFVDDNYLFNILKETSELVNYRQYQYNNYAFSLLGKLLESKTKIKFEDLIEMQILMPLKMNFTSFSYVNTTNIAGLYNQQGIVQKPMILNKVNPAGGLKSNALDLIKYLKAHLINDELNGAVNIIERTYYEDSTRKLGLGWEIKNDFFEKDGDTFGNSSLIRYSPKNQIAIVVLSNHQNGKLVRDIMNDIYSIIAIKSNKKF